jgi:hypothetical protein
MVAMHARSVGAACARLGVGLVLLVALCGCGSTHPTGQSPSPTAPSPTASATPTPSETSTPTPSATTSSTPTPTVTPSRTPAEVATAAKTALLLWEASPIELAHPNGPFVYGERPWPNTPMSYGLHARLEWLQMHDYFDDQPGHCGENYMDASQNGLLTAPRVVSVKSNPDSTVSVVVARDWQKGERQPAQDITVIMTKIGNRWYATDLRRGTGPNASIFSKNPHC